MSNEAGYVTEIPSYLKQLARLISYAFYTVEDSLIVDVLVRHPCMKEKDIEDLLKFDLKLLRGRMATLKSEKFVQLRLRMETGMDGKAQKVNYYFINYKSLVNVIKYKLDHMRKKMETQERDATNRASFKCTKPDCSKTFTDLEAGELFDPTTGLFHCTFCASLVEEDESAGPQKDSRLMLARFNEQMEQIYELLKKAEDIKLAPELLEPEPPKSANDMTDSRSSRNDQGIWSGEATRLRGINDTTRVDIRIGDAATAKPATQEKSRPIWMVESSIGHSATDTSYASTSRTTGVESSQDKGTREDIMSVLLAHEQQGGSSQSNQAQVPDDDGSSSDSDNPDSIPVSNHFGTHGSNGIHQDGHGPMDVDVGVMESDEDESVPMVAVGNDKIPLTDINEDVIARMSASEKETYIQQYQEFYAHIYD